VPCDAALRAGAHRAEGIDELGTVRPNLIQMLPPQLTQPYKQTITQRHERCLGNASTTTARKPERFGTLAVPTYP
jgi:hypothetical protein